MNGFLGTGNERKAGLLSGGPGGQAGGVASRLSVSVASIGALERIAAANAKQSSNIRDFPGRIDPPIGEFDATT